MKHELKIISLHDGMAECSCKGWSLAHTGETTREDIRREFIKHYKPKAPYQPKTGARCNCKPGVIRDNCGSCEGTGWIIDFAAIRARHHENCPGCVNCGRGTSNR